MTIYDTYPQLNDASMSVMMGKADEGFTLIDSLLQSLATSVSEAEKAEKSAETVKSEDPLALKYEKDEAGANAAAAVFNEVVGTLIDWAEDDPGRTFHMSNLVTSLGKYFATEATYFRNELVPKVQRVSQVQDAKRSFNAVHSLLDNLIGIALTRNPNLSHPAFTVDGKKVTINRVKYMGVKPASDDGSVHGRYARIYSLSWNIDGEDLEVKSLSEVVRYIYHGADRVGKNAANLAALLDTNYPEWSKADTFTHTFDVNEHKVTISRTNTGENESTEDD
jgi:hypothetical protein